MDKLKPIITHRFWILFGLALILPFVGYWMATSKLAAEITERWDTLDKAHAGIPTGAGSPNDSWITAVQQYNQKRAARNKQAHRLLWNRQTELCYWPEDIRADMEQCAYRGAIESGEAVTRVPNLYREDYETEVRRVWHLAEPLDPYTMTGKLEFPLEMMPRVPISEWQNRAPTFQEIWDAQEDLWLLTDLFQAISRVNAGANSIADAHVRKIEDIRLFGAERGTGAAGASPGGMMSGGMPSDVAMDPMMGMGMGGLPGDMVMGGGSGMGGARSVSADFNLSEEFSNVQFGSGGGRGGAGPMGMDMAMGGGFGGSMMMPEMGGPADMGAMGEMGGGTATPQVRRYVDNDEGQPYRTRGFYMKVVVDHRRVPDLLVELTNSRWPVEIIRVHQVSRGAGTSTTGAMGGAYDLAMGAGDAAAYDPAYSAGYADDMAGGAIAYDPSMAMPSGMEPLGMGSSSMMGNSMGGLGSARLRGLAQAAMADPNLATVVVAGLMTLYNEPEPEAAEAAAPDAGADPTMEPAGQPATDPAAEPMADPNAQPTASPAAVQPAVGPGDAAPPQNEEPAPPATDGAAAPEAAADGAAPAAEPAAGDAETESEPAPAANGESPPPPAAPEAGAAPTAP